MDGGCRGGLDAGPQSRCSLHKVHPTARDVSRGFADSDRRRPTAAASETPKLNRIFATVLLGCRDSASPLYLLR
jgi:hypothetical protein